MALARIKGLTIELKVDGDKVTKSLDSYEKASNRVAAKLKDINNALKFNPTSTEALTQKQQTLKERIEQTTEQLKAEKEALKQLKDSDKTEKTAQAQERLKLQIEETTGKLKSAKQEYIAFGTVGIQQAKAVGDQMVTLGNQMAATGRTLTMKVSTPLLALGGMSVKGLADFEQSMVGVGAVSQASGEQVEQMSAYARELAANTKFTANEVTDAYHYMALAGWEPQQMMDGLAGTLNLVAASGEDLGTVSDILTDGLTAFNMTAEQSGRFGDVLAVAMSKSNTSVGQLGEAFKYIGTTAGQMGYSIEDISVALGTMANAGIKGSQAGTTLRNILTRMAKHSGEVQVAMDELGITLDDGKGNMLSFAQVMTQFRDKLGNIKIPMEEFQAQISNLDTALAEGAITEKEYEDAVARLTERAYGAEGALLAQYASTIAGQRGMAGLMAIVGSSDEDWNKLTEAINNADGTAEKMRETMEGTLSGQFTILKSQVAELGMQFGEVMLPAIKDLVTWLQELTAKFQALSPETKEMVVKIAAIVAAIGPLLLVGGKLIAGIGFLIGLPAKIISGVSGIITALTAINPVVLAVVAGIAALVAAGVWLYKHWDQIKEYAVKIWTAIKNFFINTFTAIKDFIAKIWKAIWERWSTFWNNLGTWITGKLGRIRDMFKGMFIAIKDFISNIWKGVWERWSTFWNNLGIWITAKLGRIRDMFKGMFTAIKDFIAKIWMAIWERWSTFWNNLGTWITTKLGNIRNLFSRVFGAIRDTISNIWTSVKDRVVSVWTSITSWISDKVWSIKDKVTSTFSSLRERVESTFSTIKETISAPFQKAWDLVSPIVEKLKNIFPISLGKIFSGIKLPHFRISGGRAPWGIGGYGTKPSVDVEWYKKAMDRGMILNNPTIFGMMNGKLLGAGEAGSETIVGTSSLLGMIQQATRQNTISPQLIYEAVRQGASDATIKNYIDGQAMTTAVNRNITMQQSYNARFQGA